MYRKVVIRPYQADDEAGLFALARSVFGERSSWHDRWTLDVLENDVVFVAELGRFPAGYAALVRTSEAVRIEQLLVSPDHDDEGIGGQLVEYAEGYAIWLGARSLQAVVEPDNVPAVFFFRSRGFSPVDEELLELVLPWSGS